MNLAATFRDNLKRFLDNDGVSIAAFARGAGVHRVTLHKILSGQIEPSLTMVETLAGAMGYKPPQRAFNKRRTAAKTGQ